MPYGPTIEPITATGFDILTVDMDIGLLSMHSACEMGYVGNLITLLKALGAYWLGA